MPPTSDAHSRYVAERRRAVLARVQRVAVIAVAPIALAIIVNVLAFDDRLAEHLATLVLQGGICTAAAWASRRPGAARRAIALALALALGHLAIETWAVHLAGTDAAALASVLIGIMLFTSLIFPWGIGAQVITSGFAAACYLVLIDWGTIDSPRLANLVIIMSFGLVTSIAGARLLDRQRRETFFERERVGDLARQREQLLEAGHALNATVDMDALLPMLTTRGCALLASDGTAFSLWHERARTLEPLVISERDGTVVRLTLPQCPEGLLPPGYIQRLLRDGLFLLTPAEVRRAGAPNAEDTYALAAAVQRDGKLLGVLTFYTRGTNRFSEQSHRLALGFASQAAIALTNAELVHRLTEASRVKSEFVSTISHELRTPLNVILGFTEMAVDAASASPDVQECLSKISGASQDLLDLIESTLALGRLDAGRDDPRFETVSLSEFWAELRGACHRMPHAPEVALDWQDDVPARSIVTDPRKLSVVMRNLVGNALKFTPRGSVRVAAELSGDDRLRLVVADTGIGIKAEDQQRIFEMFRQADGSDSRRFGGTGLGLYIVRQYSERLGGTVVLTSAPGEGSTFEVVLPVDGGAAVRRAA